MEQQELYLMDDFQGLNLKAFFQKLIRKWYLFALFVPTFIVLAFIYGKIAEPVYKINTSLLIDVGEQQRSLGESPFVQGGLQLIGSQKNLKNEIGILGSFNLVKQAIKTLDFEVSYHSRKWMGLARREHYQYFPFEVEVHDSSFQVSGKPFVVKLLGEDRYEISFEAKEFTLFIPISHVSRMVEKRFTFKGTYKFGEEVSHEYFRFTLHKPEKPAPASEFEGKSLEFVLHSIDGLAGGYKSKLSINTIDIEASILQISTEGNVVQKEINFLQALNKAYINSKLKEKSDVASTTLSFIENQINNISDSLRTAERNLERFRRNERAIDLNFTATNALAQLQDLETQKAELQLNDQYYSSLLNNLGDSSAIEKIVSPSGMGISDPVLNELVLDLKRLNSERLKLSYTAGSNSYDLKIINQQIQSTRQSLTENLQSISRSTQRTLDDNRNRIRKVESTIARLPRNEKELVEIQRKYTLNESLYNYLRQKQAELGIAKAEQMSDSRVLDEPRMMGSSPVAPQKKLLLVVAFLAGMAIPIAIVMLKSPAAEVINGIEHLEKLTNIPVLAGIGHHRGKVDTLIPKGSQWRVAESFRDLGANLQFLFPSGRSTVLGFTSTVSGEGKTFCAANLAVSLTEAGLKILLIDLDLRNPSLLRYFEKQDYKGLSDYLSGSVDFLNEIIYPLEDDKLHFIPTSPVEGNAHKWINTERMANLIVSLREEYDYIILDMPPVGLVSDFLLLSKYIDVNFYVLRNLYSRVEFVKSLKKLDKSKQLPNLYLVLNDVKSKRFKYGYNEYKYYAEA